MPQALFYLIGNSSEITCQIKISPRDAQLAAGEFALRHRSRAKCVRAHTFSMHDRKLEIEKLTYSFLARCKFEVKEFAYSISVDMMSWWKSCFGFNISKTVCKKRKFFRCGLHLIERLIFIGGRLKC